MTVMGTVGVRVKRPGKGEREEIGVREERLEKRM